MLKEKLLIVTLLTVDSNVNIPMTISQITQLAIELRDNREPVPVITVKSTYQVVGMLIQNEPETGFHKMILTSSKKD